MLDKLQNSDMFPESISLTFDSSSTFKTVFGGICSLGAKFTILAYAIYLLLLMNRKTDIEANISTSYWNPAKDIDTYNLTMSRHSLLHLEELPIAIQVYNQGLGGYLTNKEYIKILFWRTYVNRE